MPTWLKALLALLGAGGATCGLAVGGAVYWYRTHEAGLLQATQRARQGGAAAGARVDADGCVAEALARADAKPGFGELLAHTSFLQACLEVARWPEGFCAGVPDAADPIASIAWLMRECERRKRPRDRSCQRLLPVIQSACARP